MGKFKSFLKKILPIKDNICYTTNEKEDNAKNFGVKGALFMVPVDAICNTILQKSFNEFIPVSPMKLQKLLYFVYGTYAKAYNEPLFSEDFQAWQHGPVLSSVYNEFKSFKASSITKFSKDANGATYVLNPDSTSHVINIIDDVWSKYKNCTGIDLSYITHLPGSAWYKAYTNNNDRLDFQDIVNDNTF